MKKIKLFVMGYAGHGKDTLCEILKAKHGFSFASSSRVAGLSAVYPTLKDKYGYQSFEECFADRDNHRAEWFELIKEYNKDFKGRLCKEILEEYDIYCGLRNEEELLAYIDYCREAKKEGTNLYVLVWVDRESVVLPEDTASCTIKKELCSVIIDNNGTLEDLEVKADKLITSINFMNHLNCENYMSHPFVI